MKRRSSLWNWHTTITSDNVRISLNSNHLGIRLLIIGSMLSLCANVDKKGNDLELICLRKSHFVPAKFGSQQNDNTGKPPGYDLEQAKKL